MKQFKVKLQTPSSEKNNFGHYIQNKIEGIQPNNIKGGEGTFIIIEDMIDL